MESLPGIHVAWETADLETLLAQPDLIPATDAPSPSHAALVTRLKGFIDAA